MKSLLLLGSLALLLAACSSGSQPIQHPVNQRLANSDSPYLRQHASNPVDWYPWGEEALAKAKAENKLLLVSIGYSACHWCHVMEKETFSDTAVAAFMNRHFVSIKIDREQRPDLDQYFLQAAMLTSGRGGWPLNAIASPEGQPIVAGTYFPTADWMELLQKVFTLFQQNPEQFRQIAGQTAAGIAQMTRPPFLPEAPQPDLAIPQDAARSVLPSFDPHWGGFRGAPKFPMPGLFRFLLAQGQLARDPDATKAAIALLDGLARGGIYDHVGGGFARYATDSLWNAPHFEKMLYDNAQLLALYSEGFRATGNPLYRQVVSETVGFLTREMRDSSGGFYASLDADSDGEEGKYYVWSEKDFLKTLGMKGKLFKDYFHVVPQGNWQEDKNVLFTLETPAVIAQRHGYSSEDFERMIPVAKQLLLEKRSKREAPHRDEKIITGWNALMITGLTEAYRAFGEDSLLSLAEANTASLLGTMQRPDGGLYRYTFEGKAAGKAFAEDYGLLIEALTDLYQVTFNERYLARARELMNYAQAHFRQENSPFFHQSEEGEALLGNVRLLSLEDDVLPGANASLARGLFLLGTYFGEEAMIGQAREMLRLVQPQVRSAAASYHHWARLSLWLGQAPYEVAIVGPGWKALAREWWTAYGPGVLLLGGEQEGNLPLLANKLIPGDTRIYVCQDKVCKLPVTNNAGAREQIAAFEQEKKALIP